MKIENCKTVRLGDVCEIAAGQGAPQGESNYCDDGTPFVKAGNLIELINGKDEFEIQKVSEEVANSHKLKKYSAGSILFAKSGMSCIKGYVYQLKNDSYVVSHLAIVKPKEDSSDYIEYCLRHIKPNTLVKDEAYPSISLQDISNLQIPLPPLEEQKHIAAVLDKCTEVIAKHKLMLEKYDTLVKSQFVEMFGDIIQNTKNWDTREWNEVLNIVNGKNQKAVECKDGKYAICGSGGEIGRASDFLVTENSVIIGRKGNINKPILMREKFWNVDTAFGLVPFTDKVNVEFLFYFCYFFDFERLNKAVTIPSLTKIDLLKIKIPVPPLALQQKFASFVQAVDAQKAKAQKSLDKAETLYKALMQEYFG